MRAARAMKPKASLKSLKLNFLLMASRPLTSLQPLSVASAALRALPVNFSVMIAPQLVPCGTHPLRRWPQRLSYRGFDCLAGIIGCILLAAQRLARKLNEVVRDEPYAENGVDLSARDRMSRCPPERFAVIGQDADVEHDPERQDEGAGNVRPVQSAARRGDHPVHIGRIDLVLEAREQPLGIVGVGDGAAPHRQ